MLIAILSVLFLTNTGIYNLSTFENEPMTLKASIFASGHIEFGEKYLKRQHREAEIYGLFSFIPITMTEIYLLPLINYHWGLAGAPPELGIGDTKIGLKGTLFCKRFWGLGYNSFATIPIGAKTRPKYDDICPPFTNRKVNFGMSISGIEKLIHQQRKEPFFMQESFGFISNTQEPFYDDSTFHTILPFSVNFSTKFGTLSPFVEFSSYFSLNDSLAPPKKITLGLGYKIFTFAFQFAFDRRMIEGDSARSGNWPPGWNIIIGINGLFHFRKPSVEQKIVKLPELEDLKTKGCLSGKVIDKLTGAPLLAIITFSDAKISPVATNKDGIYNVYLPADTTITLIVTKKGYKRGEELVILKPDEKKELNFSLERKSVTEVRGVITDFITGEHLKGTLSILGENIGNIVVESDALGSYNITLPPGEYRIKVGIPDYISVGRTIKCSDKDSLILENFSLLKKASQFILKGVEFSPASEELLSDSYKYLNEFASLIIESENISIEIQGHTDSKGSAMDNQILSEKRAKKVMDYLVAKGIDRSRMRAIGFGEMMPIADNLTEKGRKQNRRIEIKILE